MPCRQNHGLPILAELTFAFWRRYCPDVPGGKSSLAVGIGLLGPPRTRFTQVRVVPRLPEKGHALGLPQPH